MGQVGRVSALQVVQWAAGGAIASSVSGVLRVGEADQVGCKWAR